MKNSKIRKLFILGNHIQALGLSRIGHETGLTVTIFNDSRASVARFSNTCHSFQKFKSQDELLELLISLYDGNINTIIVPTNDTLIWFLSQNYEILKKYYFLGISQPDIIETCYNKRKTYERALKSSIPIPESYFPDSKSDLIKILDRLTYPVIIKPAVMHTFFKKTGKKVYKCENESDLLWFYNLIIKFIPQDEVIIQSFLDGGPKNLYSFGVFVADGKVQGGFVAQRIRQKPMDFGISTTFAKTVLRPELIDLGTRFLKDINYFGMAEVEFMYDEKEGNYKLIEINPRAWKWHSITRKLNLNFMEMMVSYFEGETEEPRISTLENIAWVERLTDSYIVFKEIFRRKLKFRDYLNSMKMVKESAVWSYRDPLPALMYVFLSPYLLIKRN